MQPIAKSSHSYQLFEKLYTRHAPKMLGFISNYTHTKKQAEDCLVIIFCKVWEDIKNFDSNAESKILVIALSVCKPLLKKEARFSYNESI